ncbi:hypothetical protein FRAHR75_1090012 [Frankia sp. Hr75.2]|nr:hypothetical protein FRAHR75_1090012 [Frankia sp. Hr75.2]
MPIKINERMASSGNSLHKGMTLRYE